MNIERKESFSLRQLKVDEFILMTDEQKTKLKWNYLLEKLRLGIQVSILLSLPLRQISLII